MPVTEEGCKKSWTLPFNEEARNLIQLLGKRGTLDILFAFCCTGAELRFGELQEMLTSTNVRGTGMSTKTLVARLRELEKQGLIKRRAYSEIPPRVEYSMMVGGQELTNSLVPLIRWIVRRSGTESQLEIVKGVREG